MDGWRHTYDPRDLDYLSARAKQIRDTAALLGVPSLGLAGGIARELPPSAVAPPAAPGTITRANDASDDATDVTNGLVA
jgi:hypothetical protein